MLSPEQKLQRLDRAIAGATLPEHTCACIPGTCRGGEVIDGKLANGQRCKATIPVPVDAPEATFRAVGIGDVTSDAKGSGARYNTGKPDFSLVPLSLLAGVLHRAHGDLREILALEQLGFFQQTGSIDPLYEALNILGDGGWEECAKVFEYGRRKYVVAWNWAKGMPWSVPLACAARHLLATIRGEVADPESGEPHRGHVFCNLVMLIQYTKTYTEGNDLPKKGLL